MSIPENQECLVCGKLYTLNNKHKLKKTKIQTRVKWGEAKIKAISAIFHCPTCCIHTWKKRG